MVVLECLRPRLQRLHHESLLVKAEVPDGQQLPGPSRNELQSTKLLNGYLEVSSPKVAVIKQRQFHGHEGSSIEENCLFERGLSDIPGDLSISS